jgi:3-oxoadipate enol-lactonase
LDPRQKQIETADMMKINDCSLNVEIHGQGSPLVMLHGLGSSTATFRSDVEHFRLTHQTIAIDSRGHGKSDKPGHYTITDHINDVIGVIDALDLEKAAIIGTSMGSYVAQGVAIEARERISRLVLVAPKSHGASSSSATMLEKHAAVLKDSTVQEQRDFLYEHIFAPTTPARKIEMMRAVTENRGPPLTDIEYKAAQRAIRNFDFRPRLNEITASTLVLSGHHDPLNPPAYGREIAERIRNAVFVLFENSGHVPRIEERARYLAVLDDFLG